MNIQKTFRRVNKSVQTAFLLPNFQTIKSRIFKRKIYTKFNVYMGKSVYN